MRRSRLAALVACSLLILAVGAASASATPVTVGRVLAKLAAIRAQYLTEFNQALAEEKRLTGTRRVELTAVTETLHQIAAEGEMTVSRLPELFLTLARNAQFWPSGPLPAADQRVEFAGSPLVWEYYPGQGIQLQVLGTFGAADGMFTAGPAEYPQLLALIAQMLPLAVDQDGGITWDYLFAFDGGQPPWTSAMADGTAIEALTRAYLATDNHAYLVDAAEVLPVLAAASPRGLSVPTGLGRRFLQYSFAPDTDIINAFLQTLIGLYDFAHVSGNLTALELFTSGNAEAEAELPSFNTGAWSLYQPGIEDDLSYHELVTGFLQQLCTRTAAPVYCQTATAFTADLTTPPGLIQLTTSTAANHPFRLRFRLSKVSHVGVVVRRGSRAVFSTSASFPHGTRSFTVPKLGAGAYTVNLSATDLAGNFSRITGPLRVGGAPSSGYGISH